MSFPVFPNDKAVKIMERYTKKRLEYIAQGIKKHPYEILNEIKEEDLNAENR